MNYKILFLGLLLILFTSQAYAITDLNLEDYYNFDETTGTVLIDIFDYDNNGVNQGALINQTGKIRKAYELYQDRILLTNANTFLGATKTVNTWIYPYNPDTTGNKTIWSSTNNQSPGTVEYRLFITNGTINFLGYNSSYQFQITSGNILDANNWYFITTTLTNNGAYLYVNGLLVGSDTSNTNPTTGAAGSVFGMNFGISDTNYLGLIDETSVWNRILSGTDINQLYNNGYGLTYPFDINQIYADFDYTVNELQVDLNDTSYVVGDAVIDSWEWLIDNVSSSTDQNYSFTGVEATDYNVCLIIQDTTLSLEDSTCQTISISDLTPPTTSFSSSQYANETKQKLTFICTDNDSGCKYLNYIIDSNVWIQVANTGIKDVNYSGAGSHSIQYFSTDNSGNNETIKTSNFTTYGTGHFNFYDENTYTAINSVDYNISPSINGISTGTTTGNTLDLNFQGITSGTYQFTFSKTGYGTRYYYTTINEFTDFNLQYVLLPDTNGSNLSLTIYNSTGTTLLQNTPVTITKNNYTVGRYLTTTDGIITPFIKANDTNYLFSIEGYYTTSQRIVIINRPIWDTNLDLISGTWQVTLTSPQSTTRYTITTNSRAIGILPNTTVEYIANVCMYSGSTCDPNYIQRNYLLYFKGLIGETLIQPYMNLVSASTQRTLKVLNYTTNQPYPLTPIAIYSKTQNGVNYLVESLVTDSTGTATTYLNNLQQYTITTNNSTYTIVPNADNFTYYIYVNFLTLNTPDYTSSDTNTQSDVNAPLDEFYNLRNTLFNTCTLKNDCFPAALIAIIITLIVLLVITSMALNNFIGIKGLSLVAFICLTIFFGIGWLPIYAYAFLGTISLLLLVIVQ